MKPTPERDVYDLMDALRYLWQWSPEELAPHEDLLVECAERIAVQVERAKKARKKGRRAA